MHVVYVVVWRRKRRRSSTTQALRPVNLKCSSWVSARERCDRFSSTVFMQNELCICARRVICSPVLFCYCCYYYSSVYRLFLLLLLRTFLKSINKLFEREKRVWAFLLFLSCWRKRRAFSSSFFPIFSLLFSIHCCWDIPLQVIKNGLVPTEAEEAEEEEEEELRVAVVQSSKHAATTFYSAQLSSALIFVACCLLLLNAAARQAFFIIS